MYVFILDETIDIIYKPKYYLSKVFSLKWLWIELE